MEKPCKHCEEFFTPRIRKITKIQKKYKFHTKKIQIETIVTACILKE